MPQGFALFFYPSVGGIRLGSALFFQAEVSIGEELLTGFILRRAGIQDGRMVWAR